MSERANAPRIVAALPLDGNQPRFAPESLAAWGSHGVELYRWQVAPLLEPDRLALRAGLSQAGLKAVFISSADEAGEGWTVRELQEAFELARFFRAEGVVTTAPSANPTAEGEPATVVGWLNSALAQAEASALPLLIENRPGTWAGHSRDVNRLIGQADSPWLRVAFNPLGFAALREHPFLTAFMSGRLKSWTQLLRIQDATFEDGRPVRVNDGNAEIAELVSAALARGYAGFFAVGHSQVGLEDIRLALDDFRRLLTELGLEDGVI